MKGHIDSFRGKLTMYLSCFVDSEEEKCGFIFSGIVGLLSKSFIVSK